LSRLHHLKLFFNHVQKIIGANVGFEIVISHILGKLTKFGGAIRSGVLIQ
jgi:hypothetical protein